MARILQEEKLNRRCKQRKIPEILENGRNSGAPAVLADRCSKDVHRVTAQGEQRRKKNGAKLRATLDTSALRQENFSQLSKGKRRKLGRRKRQRKD